MMCSGPIYCKIYRDKKFCSKDHAEPGRTRKEAEAALAKEG